jgi:ribosomal protein S18 acetylase RimI-like enzyme
MVPLGHLSGCRATAPSRKKAPVTEIVIPLVIRDLTPEDLPWCQWSGSPAHLVTVANELARARKGEVDYLAACPPADLPVAIGGIDYAENPGAGTLYQLSVHPALQSCGIGTFLIRASEQRIRARGLLQAEPGVEESNQRPSSV